MTMMGSFLALLSLLVTLAAATNMRPDLAQSGQLALLALALLLALWAAYRKGRPILLLAAQSAVVIAFVCLPQGLAYCLQSLDVNPTLMRSAFGLLVPLAAILSIFFFFWLSCWKQSGGFALSAQEASEDIERLLNGIGYVALAALAFLFVAELFQALQSALLAAQSWTRSGTADLLSLPDMMLLAADRHDMTHVAIWAILLCTGLTYLRNRHQRGLGRTPKSCEMRQAFRELVGAIFCLLPTCWLMLRYVAIHLPAEKVADSGWVGRVAVNHTDQVETILSLFYSLVPALSVQVGIGLLGAAAMAVALRSLVFLVGPDYLKRRAASHVTLQAGSRFLRPGTAIVEPEKSTHSKREEMEWT